MCSTAHLREAGLMGLEKEAVHVGHLHLVVVEEQQLADPTSVQRKFFLKSELPSENRTVPYSSFFYVFEPN